MSTTIRPRSRLSIREHYRIRDKSRVYRKNGNTVLTLAGFCIFLLILCVFLLAALVYVGRNIINKSRVKDNINNVELQSSAKLEHLKENSALFTQPIISFRPVYIQPTLTSNSQLNQSYHSNYTMTLTPHVKSTSKVLTLLSYRLPGDLKPQSYKLYLHPDFATKKFKGHVNILLEILKPISFIPVHSKNLNVSTQEVWQLNSDGSTKHRLVPILTYAHPQFEYWITEFAQPLEVGTYSLKLSFNGSLENSIVGFYQSSYINQKSKEKRWIATSKFEPTYARQAFPCFDEPALKAKFTITLVQPTGNGYNALSNMNVESKNVLGNLTEVKFSESVPMSTYLSCFIVSDFVSKTATVRGILPDAKNFEMRVYSTDTQVNKVAYALEIGVNITEFYIEYFNISYPLPKLDMAAIPDFVSGAMEHWGIVTYRETTLLYDEKNSSSINRQRVATVVAHELAHMWFGNLVTMKWWNDLWLNEGFASFIEYKGINNVHPEWKMLDQFLIADLHDVMKLDATLASHPIVQTVENPSQITELFDSITYSKGASIIRMLENFVGEEKFRDATTNYLNRFRYSNAETNDFLNEMESLVSDYDLKLLVQTWTEQMGLPLVEVVGSGKNFKLTQKRFFANAEDYNDTYADSHFNYHWSIPITYFTNCDQNVSSLIFHFNDKEVAINLPTEVDWIKINKNQVGYYSVNYPLYMWQTLTTALMETRDTFSSADRANLINDVFALADGGQLNYSVALNLSKYLYNETEYVPWKVALLRFTAIKNLIHTIDVYNEFINYVRQLLHTITELVTWDVGADHLNNLLRITVLSASCAFNNPKALSEANTRFHKWLNDTNERPHPDIRSIVYYYGMRDSGNEKIWNQVWDLYITEQDAQEKQKLMQALSAVKEPRLLQRYINRAWDENYVRRQDYFACLQYISRNEIGESLVWDYLRENWSNFVQRFGLDDRYLGRLIPSITSRFSTQTKLSEMKAFFAKYPEPGAGKAARKEALEVVKNNMKWLEQNRKPISEWLFKQGANGEEGFNTNYN